MGAINKLFEVYRSWARRRPGLAEGVFPLFRYSECDVNPVVQLAEGCYDPTRLMLLTFIGSFAALAVISALSDRVPLYKKKFAIKNKVHWCLYTTGALYSLFFAIRAVQYLRSDVYKASKGKQLRDAGTMDTDELLCMAVGSYTFQLLAIPVVYFVSGSLPKWSEIQLLVTAFVLSATCVSESSCSYIALNFLACALADPLIKASVALVAFNEKKLVGDIVVMISDVFLMIAYMARILIFLLCMKRLSAVSHERHELSGYLNQSVTVALSFWTSLVVSWGFEIRTILYRMGSDTYTAARESGKGSVLSFDRSTPSGTKKDQ